MDSTTFYTKQEASAERKAFYARLKTQNAAPLWEVLGDLVRSDPRTACVPTLWRYDDVRPLIKEAGAIITAEEAERPAAAIAGGEHAVRALAVGGNGGGCDGDVGHLLCRLHYAAAASERRTPTLCTSRTRLSEPRTLFAVMSF